MCAAHLLLVPKLTMSKLGTSKSSMGTASPIIDTHSSGNTGGTTADTGFHGSGQVSFTDHGNHSESGSFSYSGTHGGFNVNLEHTSHTNFSIGGYVKF